ncbi:serine/arginine-rich splicing factor 6-like isoform X1 [Gymnodraco acuticeps]|uniref:Serine/arginine-rich splicing factor 6-like isoform X1 n=1 Tax=Gymnodraco acuticeps TaxID=8218 RepID=A0A6P8TMM9_GYMAC|nr:serine/arginine-rich splicing factor 6-like isoform X1 [Gymnodraco acuticeps]
MPRVYIGRLSYNVREKDIQRFFSGYGKLMEIDLKNGYGFVEFDDNRDADDAVYELNGKELCGERVIIENARGPRRDRDRDRDGDRDGHGGGYRGGGPSSGYSSRSHTGRDKYGPPVRTEYRVIVENLSSRCSWQDLKDFMRQAGEVTYADAHKERTNEGVIEFRSHSDMKRAIDKLDGTDINGRKIHLVADRQHKRRSDPGSRSRSRSRRRSHSKSSRSRSRSGSRSNKRRGQSRSRSGRKSRSKSGESKSRSRNRRSRSRKSKSRSNSRKSRSGSAERKSKSRSKSRSKVKSERGSRSPSKEMSVDKKSRCRSASPLENGKDEHVAKSASRSPTPHEDDRRSKSKEKSSPSLSRSRSRSRSASQD